MKSFTVTETEVYEGLSVETDPYPHIQVGGRGKGARYTRVPLGRQDFSGVTRVERCHPITTKGKGTLLLVKEQRPDHRRAMVLVSVRGGEKGSSYVLNEDGHNVLDLDDSGRGAYGLRLLAAGHSSDGMYGRSGGPHVQMLLILNEGSCVCVERRGQINTGLSKVWIRWRPETGLVTGSLADIFPDEREAV